MDKRKRRKNSRNGNGPTNPVLGGSILHEIRQENSELTKDVENSIKDALEGLEIKYFRNMGGQ